MIVGIGRSPIADFIIKYYNEYVGKALYPYPLFLDDKKLLLQGKKARYVQRLWANKNVTKIALYPDYTYEILNLPKHILYILPIHDLRKDYELYCKLKEKYNIWPGYASDVKYRNYSLEDFLEEFKGEKLWYLGVSTKTELKEALMFNFQGMDVTGFLFGKNEDRKNALKLRRMLTDFLKQVSKPQGRQLTLYDFCGKLGSLR
jgi:hypothetical protein